MRLNQYKKWHWKDTDYLRELKEKEIVEALEKQGKTQQEIDKALREVAFEVPKGELKEPDTTVSITLPPTTMGGMLAFEEPKEDPEEFGLTEEEVLRLQLR